MLSSPIQTLLSVLELHQIKAKCFRGLYHRSGITPCPEDLFCTHYSFFQSACQDFFYTYTPLSLFWNIIFDMLMNLC